MRACWFELRVVLLRGLLKERVVIVEVIVPCRPWLGAHEVQAGKEVQVEVT